MGTFRVLIAGGHHFSDYKLLRATLDKLLANRMPDVELLTTGGPGVAMLAASYATERGLTFTPRVPDFVRFTEEVAVERRDAELVALTDAAVVVFDARDTSAKRIAESVARKGISVRGVYRTEYDRRRFRTCGCHHALHRHLPRVLDQIDRSRGSRRNVVRLSGLRDQYQSSRSLQAPDE